MKYVGFVDLSGIQEFVFRESELKKIAAASQHIESFSADDGLFRTAAKDNGVRVIAAAGGNASFYSDDEAKLKACLKKISLSLIREGKGVGGVTALCQTSGSIAADWPEFALSVAEAKNSQPRSLHTILPGFKEPDIDLGTPDPGRAVTWEGAMGYQPYDMDDLIGPSEEQSNLMAVVSVDGIGMGKRLIEWLASMERADDEDFIREFSWWSEAVKDRWSNAWEKATQELMGKFSQGWLGHGYVDGREFKLNFLAKTHKANGDVKDRYTDRYALPFRKIYQGGDDMSFVCDARIAIPLSVMLARELAVPPPNMPEKFKALPVSIGIVFADAHFPYSQAAILADRVRREGKAVSATIDPANPPSVLNWYLNRQARPSYSTSQRTMRPFLLESKHGRFAWPEAEEALKQLWRAYEGQRNKLKALFEAAMGGKTSVKKLLELRPLNNGARKLPLGGGLDDWGFIGDETPLPDLGEIVDIHFPVA